MTQSTSDNNLDLLKDALKTCLDDSRVKLYFDRNLVERDLVTSIMLAPLKVQEVSIETGYQKYVEKRNTRTTARAEIAVELKDGIRNRYAVVAVTGMTLAIIALIAIYLFGYGMYPRWYLLMTALGTGSVTLGGMLAGSLIWPNTDSDAARRPLNQSSIDFGPVFRLALLIVVFPAILLFVGILTNVINDLPALLICCWTGGVVMGFVGRRPDTVDDGGRILGGYRLVTSSVSDSWANRSEERALRAALPGLLIPFVRQVITEKLGPLYNTVLVEQDASGLRRTRTLDPKYLIPTDSERLVLRRIRQINGGTVALAGQRGAGKSTVLTRVMPMIDERSLRILVPAPAEYEAHEFLRNLFQQLCEAYLRSVGYPRHDAMLGRLLTPRDRRHRLWTVVRWLISVLLILTAGAVGAIGLLRNIQAGPALERIVNGVTETAKNVWTWAGQGSTSRVLDIALVVIALFLLRKRWRPPQHRTSLSDEASQYIYRLRLNHTLNRHMTASVPVVRYGPAFGMSRSQSISPAPFTFPELVGNLRDFLKELARYRPVVIGIDEVDRLGTADQVEQFVRDIKTIFDIERCYFLITVADDVGALFAQRTLSGGNVFDSAFDDVIEIEPLSLDEARVLLQRRAAGFTEPFVWLLFSLSGGFPRELLRLARRLVDLNEEAYGRLGIDQSRPTSQWLELAPRIHTLAAALVHAETLQVVRAVRRRLGSPSPGRSWSGAIERMRPITQSWSDEPALVIPRTHELRSLAEWLSLPRAGSLNNTNSTDTDQVMRSLGTYLHFVLTVLETFSDGAFRDDPTYENDGSFEHLAAARREIGVSPEGSLEILKRFRNARRLSEVTAPTKGGDASRPR